MNREGLQKLHEAIVADDDAITKMLEELKQDAWRDCVVLIAEKLLEREFLRLLSFEEVAKAFLVFFKIGYLVGRQWDKLDAYRSLLEVEFPDKRSEDGTSF